MINNVYPYELVFELSNTDSRRLAIARAAELLQLKTTADASAIRVTIGSPIESYRLGQKTYGFLDGDPAPMPVRKPPEEA